MPQLSVLHSLDEDQTRFYHFIMITISGVGYLTDAYDFFAISLIIDLVGYHHYQGRIPRSVQAAIYGIALCGAVLGQLFFGWLGDKMGRKPIYGVTLVLMVVTSLASGFSFGSGGGAKNVVVMLCFFRFWLGVSIGGDYPLSATIMSEWANKRRRGAFIAAAFAMQGLGNLAAGVVGMVVAAAFVKSAPHNADFVWRIVLMLGAVPAIPTYYGRMAMPETARHTALVAMDIRRAASDMSPVLNVVMVTTPADDEAVNELARQHQYGLFSVEFLHQHGVRLLATSMCWMALDVIFYSLILFIKDIFTEIGMLPSPQQHGSPFERSIKIAAVYTAISLVGTLPGYFFAVALVDRVGRIRIQQLGFAMLSVCTVCLAAPYGDHFWSRHKYGFAAAYAITTFVANFANTTTLIIPAEIFPARLRSTCHGISGAFGKVGAIIGVLAFLQAESHGIRIMLFALVGCSLVGFVFTWFLPETKGRSLEEITGEVEAQQPEQDASAPVTAAKDLHVYTVY